VSQSTRKLHEDLRVHVLEQMTEIEGLRQNAENSRQALLLLENRLKGKKSGLLSYLIMSNHNL
jgi:hypothetical protein